MYIFFINQDIRQNLQKMVELLGFLHCDELVNLDPSSQELGTAMSPDSWILATIPSFSW